nr:MAG TPA: hypothetical protein [Caudoviricetes sp.]DAM00363.1 MAG TPA: hypothetical protein [Caudoviricetes sp.]DAP61354.1 MAG TPA: hypothetical protein [Caudoviricetes sp.]DAY36677.1 MAG TPA: hypothetical protein [Caudoviricetes sp.]
MVMRLTDSLYLIGTILSLSLCLIQKQGVKPIQRHMPAV